MPSPSLLIPVTDQEISLTAASLHRQILRKTAPEIATREIKFSIVALQWFQLTVKGELLPFYIFPTKQA
jgi:hypothetical protein